MQNNVEVVHTYRQHIVNDMNPGNLHLFINAYNRYWAAARPCRVPCVGLERGLRRRGLLNLGEDAAPDLQQIDYWDRDKVPWCFRHFARSSATAPDHGEGGKHEGDTVKPSRGLESALCSG